MKRRVESMDSGGSGETLAQDLGLGLGWSEGREGASRKGTWASSWTERVGNPDTVPSGGCSQLGHVGAVSGLPAQRVTGLVTKGV